MSTCHLTSDAIGKILFTQRNALGKSQRAIANEMDYKNVNFISMMENGRSNIPLGRIMDLVRAYEMPADFGLAIMATYYPDMIAIIQEFMESKEIKNILKKSEKEIENDLSQIVEREAESVGLSF